MAWYASASHMRIHCVLLLFAALILSACAQRSNGTNVQLIERARPSMGSELRLKVWTTDPAKFEIAFNSISGEFDRLEGLMSTWKDGSEIQALNQAAGKHPVPVGTDVLNVLITARHVSEWTSGKFDVTWGAMSGLWKFDYQNKDGTIPDSREIEQRRKLINYRDLELDEKAGTAFLRRDGMIANLGGIGKGYAIDRAVEILRQQGLHDFMVQFGGDMYVAGKSGDRPWKLGIQDPRGQENQIFATVELKDETFSTSGDYERYFIKDGKRYHHIIDPASGAPAEASRSVTIVAKNATLADGLSTGIFILGPERGMAVIEQLPGVEAVIVGSNNKVVVSSGLKDRLHMLAPPTDAP